ncbi:MAG: hypothetical protein CVT49_16075 [candidate division Zixibacteria bacterium HGW-Zixibacteria-1]|nr:MAG: hypothetical protein CVT49_16075 [candidate division Zixibacteria bacterium HGW-Zixibacteria-1]
MNKILFVDDEPNVIYALKRQLSKLTLDCECQGAFSAEEAIQLIEKSDFDTIILDIRMPGMDGIELLAHLKADARKKYIPIIMLTGCAERELKHKALELGAFDFVNKPADPHELAARIKGALRIKSYEDQLRDQNIILEQQLIQSQKMELMGLLANSVAHDLNNILAVISGNTELAAIKASGIKGVEANLDHARKSCDHGASLVQQILWLGRGADSECKLHDLRSVIDESLMLLTVLIPKTIDVTWSRPDSPCFSYIHQTQMIQVLMNLITNAIHAMRNGGTLTISISNGHAIENLWIQSQNPAPGPYYKIIVADTGAGIDPTIINHIFDSFYTTKPKGKGTGIGLSIVNRILTNLHGYVTVDSEINVGTSFSVYLPAVEDNPNEKLESEASIGSKDSNPVC